MPINNGNNSYNKLGMFVFCFAFVLTIIFFIYVGVINPGPIDTGVFQVPLQFSSAEAQERTTSWKALTPENIAYGATLYQVNCTSCHAQSGADVALQRASSGGLKYGSAPLEMYRFVRNGVESHPRFDYIPEREKWAMIGFIRSKAPNPAEDSDGAWKAFLKEGLY